MHVRIRYMRYAVQVATETEKTTYYPEKIERMEKTTRRPEIEIEKNHKSKREGKKKKEKKKVQFRKEKQDIVKGNTQNNAHIFADCRLARYARGVEQR